MPHSSRFRTRIWELARCTILLPASPSNGSSTTIRNAHARSGQGFVAARRVGSVSAPRRSVAPSWRLCRRVTARDELSTSRLLRSSSPAAVHWPIFSAPTTISEKCSSVDSRGCHRRRASLSNSSHVSTTDDFRVAGSVSNPPSSPTSARLRCPRFRNRRAGRALGYVDAGSLQPRRARVSRTTAEARAASRPGDRKRACALFAIPR